MLGILYEYPSVSVNDCWGCGNGNCGWDAGGWGACGGIWAVGGKAAAAFDSDAEPETGAAGKYCEDGFGIATCDASIVSPYVGRGEGNRGSGNWSLCGTCGG